MRDSFRRPHDLPQGNRLRRRDPPVVGRAAEFLSMAIVYVLRSLKNNKRYVGCTEKSAEERLLEHNSGSNQWTRQNRPLKLIYTEVFETLQEALTRERFLKSGQGRKWLDQNIPR